MQITTEPVKAEEFAWRAGSRIWQTDANEFGRWLKPHGMVKAEQLVKLCEPEDTPGHDHIYRYTDEEAVQLHREERARHLLSSLRPVVEIVGGGIVEIPAYPSIPEALLTDEERAEFEGTHSREVYVPWQRVSSDEVMLDYLAEEAKAAAATWRRTYKAYRNREQFQALLPIFEGVDKALDKEV